MTKTKNTVDPAMKAFALIMTLTCFAPAFLFAHEAMYSFYKLKSYPILAMAPMFYVAISCSMAWTYKLIYAPKSYFATVLLVLTHVAFVVGTAVTVYAGYLGDGLQEAFERAFCLSLVFGMGFLHLLSNKTKSK